MDVREIVDDGVVMLTFKQLGSTTEQTPVNPPLQDNDLSSKSVKRRANVLTMQDVNSLERASAARSSS